VRGSDPALDEAIVLNDGMNRFLQQNMDEQAPMGSVLQELFAATSLNFDAQ